MYYLLNGMDGAKVRVESEILIVQRMDSTIPQGPRNRKAWPELERATARSVGSRVRIFGRKENLLSLGEIQRDEAWSDENVSLPSTEMLRGEE
ncbi:hypothetical protein DY000_02061636 [Brassica cretica]|uniref:Uncharacterized protein n=1 Tax=Brassica cretica TaxID=69181 RepID=A0ABQ7B149_BRACR|nr:hypothetical protein DY000_02061636 [Brassica cretica]